jgi:type IV pilus assembly protein PilB
MPAVMSRFARRPESPNPLDAPPVKATLPLGEMLIGRGAATPASVRAALRRQRRDKRRIGELLVDAGVREGEVVAALAEQLGYDPVDLEKVTPEQEALYLIDPATAHALGALPLLIDDLGMVHCAVADPADTARMDTLRETVGHPVFPRLAGRLALERALDRHYTVLHKVDHAVARAVVDRQEAPAASLAIPLRADAPVVQIVDLLLTQALRDRASDVHVEPQADRLRIRFRIDGALHDVNDLPTTLVGPIASRLKILANMDIVDRHRSQDGQLEMTIDGRPVDIRVSTMETIWGEKVVLRLLDRTRSLVPLPELGLQSAARERVRRLIDSPYGMLVVAGPTGAGKTTTLYAALSELDSAARNITTIEDPVEYRFENINQVQINRLAGTTFANGLKAILRQDPDIILVGEVRDVETAQIAIQSALTGHLVLCSMHAADSVGAIYRFIDMGIEPYLVASALIGVVAQRLVRLVCARCAGSAPPTAAEAAFFRTTTGAEPPARLPQAVGCARCTGTGFHSRVGVFECLQVDDPVREKIVARSRHAELLESAVGNGMHTLQQAGCDVAASGRTTLTEVMRTVYTI